MAIFLHTALHVVTLFLLVTLFHRWGRFIGAAIFALLTVPLQLPVVGAPYRLLTNTFGFMLVFKVAGWLISGSGALLGYIGYTWIFGSLAGRSEQCSLILASFACISTSARGVLLFEDYRVNESMLLVAHLAKTTGYMRLQFETLETEQRRAFVSRLARTSLIDTYISSLFSLLNALALLFFAFGRMHVIAPIAEGFSIWDAMRAAYATSPFGGGLGVFSGGRWEFVRSCAQFLVFLWVVVYISVAGDLIRDDDLIKVADSLGPVGKSTSDAEEHDQVASAAQEPASTENVKRDDRKDVASAAADEPRSSKAN